MGRVHFSMALEDCVGGSLALVALASQPAQVPLSGMPLLLHPAFVLSTAVVPTSGALGAPGAGAGALPLSLASSGL